MSLLPRNEKCILLNNGAFKMRKMRNENELEVMYDEMIDECNPIVRIGPLEYSPSWVLKQVDETAYRIGLQEFIDWIREEEE